MFLLARPVPQWIAKILVGSILRTGYSKLNVFYVIVFLKNPFPIL